MSDIVLAAIIAAIATIIAALISKYDMLSLIWRAQFNLSGEWRGMSVYIPINIFNVDSECVYKFSARISQIGRKITFNETIENFFDINMNPLTRLPRQIEGKGKLFGDQDVIIQFKELNSSTCGAMYLVVDRRGIELEGIVAVTNANFHRPVAVRIILRRIDQEEVTEDELDLPRVKAIANTFSSQPPGSSWIVS